LIELLFELGGVVGVATVEQTAGTGIDGNEVIGTAEDPGSPGHKQYDCGDTKNQQMQVLPFKAHDSSTIWRERTCAILLKSQKGYPSPTETAGSDWQGYSDRLAKSIITTWTEDA
jgi:hypothetical protein